MGELNEKVLAEAVRDEKLRSKLFQELGINEKDLESLLSDYDKTRTNQCVV